MIVMLLTISFFLAVLAALSWRRWRRLAADVEDLSAQFAAICEGAGERRLPHLSARTGTLQGFAAALEQHLAEEARRTQAAARREEALLGFVTTASRALSTPVDHLCGKVAQLHSQAEALPEDLRAHIAEARDHAGALSTRLNCYAALAQLKSGAVCLSPEATDLSRLARETLAGFAPRLEAAGFMVDADLPQTPVVRTVDAKAVGHILETFIDNAIRYGADGGYLRLALAETADGVSLTVEDHGAGLDPEAQARLFTSESAAAGGLGLTLARALADAMDATLSCDSLPHLCTMFTLWLKCEDCGQDSEAA